MVTLDMDALRVSSGIIVGLVLIFEEENKIWRIVSTIYNFWKIHGREENEKERERESQSLFYCLNQNCALLVITRSIYTAR